MTFEKDAVRGKSDHYKRHATRNCGVTCLNIVMKFNSNRYEIFVIIYSLFSNIYGNKKKLSETSHILNWQIIREQKIVELLESTKPTVAQSAYF